MRNKLFTILLVAATCILSACSNDEDTTPSMADNDRLETLIDTSNSDIMSFKNEYGTYILSDFDLLLDFAYQFEEASAWRSAVITKLDKADVQNAMDFLKENFFNYYSKDIIKQYFPRKILICKSIYAGTLGLSSVSGTNYHTATASINSMTIAKLDKATQQSMSSTEKVAYLKQLHYIYLASYLIGSRGNLFVDTSFYNFTTTLYSSLIDENRTQVQFFSDEYFYAKGFFKPTDGSDTYFCNQQEDLVNFVRNLIFMDQTQHDTLLQYSIMKQKMYLVIKGLQDLGIRIEEINPLVKDFE